MIIKLCTAPPTPLENSHNQMFLIVSCLTLYQTATTFNDPEAEGCEKQWGTR